MSAGKVLEFAGGGIYWLGSGNWGSDWRCNFGSLDVAICRIARVIPLLQWGTVQSREFYWAAGLNGLAHYGFGISVGCEFQGNSLINASIGGGHGQAAPVEWHGTVRRLCHYVAAMVQMDLAGCGLSLNMVSVVGAGGGLTGCVLAQVLIFSNTVVS